MLGVIGHPVRPAQKRGMEGSHRSCVMVNYPGPLTEPQFIYKMGLTVPTSEGCLEG